MEEIPNKVRDMMGILVDVNLQEKDCKSYLEIVTEAYPICFRGKHYQSKSACMLLWGQSENPVAFSLPVSRIMRTVWIV